MISRSLKALGVTSVVLLAATVAVFAQTAPPVAPQPGATVAGSVTASPMAACRADMKTLCAGVERGKGAKLKCLVENKDKASAECQAVMASMQERGGKRAGQKANKAGKGGRLAACQSDVAALCPEVEKGGGRAQCLRQNETKVSPACGAAMKELKDARLNGASQARAACKSEAQALCGTIEKGRGGLMKCLRANEAKASPECSQALAALPLRKRDRKEPAAASGVVPAPATSAPAIPKPQ